MIGRTKSCATQTCLCLFATLTYFSNMAVVSEGNPYVDPTNSSVIRWDSLPPIPEAINQTSTTSRPGTLASMAEGFVDLVQPQGIPFDYVTFALQNTVYNDTKYYQDNWQSEMWKIMGLIVGIVVCVLFGILYCLIVPPTGLFFGCCRCCDRCGGKRVQRETKHVGCKRVTLSLFFLAITGVICAGMAFTNVSNEFMQDSIDEFKGTADSSFTYLESYFNGASEQLDYINTEYEFVDGLLRDNLNNIGQEIGGPLDEFIRTEAGLQEVINGVNSITNTLTQMQNALTETNSLREVLIGNSSNLQIELDQVNVALADINTNCGDCVPDVDQVNITADFSKLPSLDPQIAGVSEAKEVANNGTTEIQMGLDEIPAQVTNASQGSVNDALQQLDNFKQKFNDTFSEITQTVSDVATTLVDAKSQLDTAWMDYVAQYKQYVYYGLIGLTCTVLLIVMFNLIGMTMGTFSYKNVCPTERSRMSNAGGNVLMAGVFFTFLFAPFLMLITLVFFFGMSFATLICGPLLSYQAFNETIDQPNVVIDGYYLGSVLLKNSSIPLTATGILTDCDQDAPAYSAFKLESVYDLQSIEQQLDQLQIEVDKLVSQIDPSDVQVDIPFADITNDIDQLLNTTELGNINYTRFDDVLSMGVTALNLTEYAANLRVIGDANPVVKTDLDTQAAALLQIQENIVDPMEENVNQIRSNLATVQSLQSTLDDQIAATVDAINVTDVIISGNATGNALVDISQEYGNRLVDYGNQFYYQIEYQVTKDFGKCKLVAAVYAYSIKSTCDYPIASLNTLWFTLGWCVFFYVPSIIFAVKLAKYYRIMDEEAPYRAPKSKTKKKKGERRDSDEEMPLDDMETGLTSRMHDNSRGECLERTTYVW